MNQSHTSKPVDPFQGKSILSLHPRTFRDSNASLKSNDLEAIHLHMSSMALQNPDKHFEEAKSIIDGGSEFLNTKENHEPNMKENENPRKTRPSLPRKRATFSMKPATSQPSTIVEPTFKMDRLRTPEEFFAAYHDFEKCHKEWKRLRGGEDPNEPKIITTARQRRPEMPRRKAIYKHHVYSSQPENDTIISQETLQDTIKSQPIHITQHESVIRNSQSKEKEAGGSVTNAEDRVFDDLMSSNIADLDGNEAFSYLRDRLNIKPVAIDDLKLPNFHDVPTLKNILSSVNLSKNKNLLSDTRALSDNLKENTPGKQKKLSDKPDNLPSSPTPPRSSLIANHITFSPYSARGTDLFPATTTSEIVSEPLTHTCEDIPVSASEDKEFPGSASKDNLSELQINIEAREQHHNVEEMDKDIQGNAEEMVEKTSPMKLYLNFEDTTDDIHYEQENVKDATEKAVSSSLPDENVEITTTKETESNCCHSDNVPDASLPVQNSDNVPEKQNEEHLKASMNNRKKTRAGKIDQERKRHRLEAQTDDGSENVTDASLRVQNLNNVPEKQKEEHPKTSMNSRKKTRASKIDPKKKRHSLAGGGSCWISGVRRSNRIKHKPLEYWKGERLLYARVHNSLPTVVGVKYISPSDSNGKPGFKVESFVSDKYKDLVEVVSLH